MMDAANGEICTYGVRGIWKTSHFFNDSKKAPKISLEKCTKCMVVVHRELKSSKT